MAVDIFEPRTLYGVQKRLPQTRTFLRDTFFKNTVTFDTETVSWDYVKGSRSMARFVHPQLAAGFVKPEGYETKTYKPPLVSETVITTAADLMNRMPGELPWNSGVDPTQRAVQKLAQDMQKLEDMVTRREEWMAAQVIFTGQIPIVGIGLNETIDFEFENNIELTTDKWSDTSTDILGQLEDWSEQLERDGLVSPNMVLMDRKAASALIHNTEMKELLDIRNYELARIAPNKLPNGTTWIGSYPKLNLDFYQYNDWYLDTWTDPENPTTMQMVPEGTVVLISDDTQFSKLYGGIVTISEGELWRIGLPRMTDSWVEKNPDRQILRMQSRPLMVPHEPDGWMVVKVL